MRLANDGRKWLKTKLPRRCVQKLKDAIYADSLGDVAPHITPMREILIVRLCQCMII